MSTSDLLRATTAKLRERQTFGHDDPAETWLELAEMRDLVRELRIQLCAYNPWATMSFESVGEQFNNTLRALGPDAASYDSTEEADGRCKCGHLKTDHRPSCEKPAANERGWCTCARAYGYASAQDRREIQSMIAAESKVLL